MSFVDELRRLSAVDSRETRLNQSIETTMKSVREQARTAAYRGSRSIAGFPGGIDYEDYTFYPDSSLKLFIGSENERKAERNKQSKFYLEGTLGMGKTVTEKLLPHLLIKYNDANDANYVATQLLSHFKAEGYSSYSTKVVKLHEVVRTRKGGLAGDRFSYSETGTCFYAVRISVSW